MNPRERVRCTLDYEALDRCPMHILFTPDFAHRLKKDLIHRGYQVGKTDYRPMGGRYPHGLDRIIGSDMLIYNVGWATYYFLDGETYIDEWEVKWREILFDTPFGKGRYTEVIEHPLAKDDAIDSYHPPNPSHPELYSDMKRMIGDFKDQYWIVGGALTTSFECAKDLRGLEKILMDLVLNPEIVERILDIPYQYHKSVAKTFTKMGVDMIWLGDDVGAQHSMLISPKHWRKYIKPLLADIIMEVKSINPHVKVAYHSDGHIYPIIPELIEIGLDVLNPIQPGAMNPAQLKKEFGEHLCFWGSIDQQHT
jgi:uroporphyrinogen decarboxylase